MGAGGEVSAAASARWLRLIPESVQCSVLHVVPSENPELERRFDHWRFYRGSLTFSSLCSRLCIIRKYLHLSVGRESARMRKHCVSCKVLFCITECSFCPRCWTVIEKNLRVLLQINH